MFQNITDELKHDEEEDVEINSKISKKDILKKLFSIQHIVLYAISFMVSMVSLNGHIAPFGLAMFVAVCSNGIASGVLIITCLLGTLIKFGPGRIIKLCTNNIGIYDNDSNF